MLNTNYTITSYDDNQAILQWSAALATDVSYVFVNGNIVLGNFAFTTADRIMLIPFSKNKCIIVEVHDFAIPEDSVKPITVSSNKKPNITWLGVPEAVKYKIYANNKLLYTVLKQGDNLNYQKVITFPEFYGKIWTWHFFTVTSVDLYGNESLLLYFPYFIWDLPPIVKEISVSNGSSAGLYNFTITL